MILKRRNFQTFELILIVILQIVSYFNAFSDASKHLTKENFVKPVRKLAPCQACRALVTSFNVGLQRTAKGHYGGGDTAWEQENKIKYEDSELRFIEIQEGICKELGDEKEQCVELAKKYETYLEEWWKTKGAQNDELMTWLCINKLKVCCPENHYGIHCLPCSDCSGHGKCKGNGTRKGNGECSCDTAYSGRNCDKCAANHYEAYRDSTKLLCSACHKACEGGCQGAGAKSCVACKEGWEIDEERGCIDLNECLLELEPCKKNEFCVNAEGSYKCIECDKSCDGCFGDGPDMCEKCGSGFILQDKICLDGSTAQRAFQINTTRYLTYFGLCVATCIIFQKNFVIASIIGLAVGVYITASEYLLTKSQP